MDQHIRHSNVLEAGRPPSPRQRHDGIRRLAENEISAASSMRNTLICAASEIARLHLELGSPVVGYEMADIFGLLRDITPACDAAMERRIYAAAAIKFDGLEMGGDE